MNTETQDTADNLITHLARPEVRALPAYNAGLSSEVVRQRYGVDYVARLASNENPYGPSPRLVEAMASLAQTVGLYPDANSLELRAAIATRTGAEATQIVVGNGSENLLEVLCQAFLSPGDRIVTLIPSFGLHEIYPQMMGAKVDMISVTPALEFDVDAWCEALAQNPPPKMAILSNPSNPVGCMLDTAAFERIVQAAPEQTLLVIDEAYYEYAVHTSGFPDALTYLRQQQRPWIVLRTFSKAWGLAGLRVGYGIASDKRLVQMLDRVRTPFNVNMAAQKAALTVWNDSPYMEQCVRDTVAQREWLAAQLRQRGYFMAPSAANFLFVQVVRPNVAVAEGLLQHGVIVKPWKEAGYETYIRVSIGSATDNQLFLDALDSVVERL